MAVKFLIHNAPASAVSVMRTIAATGVITGVRMVAATTGAIVRRNVR